VNHDSPPVWPHNRPIQLPLLPPCGWISHYGLGLEVWVLNDDLRLEWPINVIPKSCI
jgi:hypothetical protein